MSKALISVHKPGPPSILGVRGAPTPGAPRPSTRLWAEGFLIPTSRPPCPGPWSSLRKLGRREVNTLPQDTQLLTFALLTTPSWMDGASSNSHVPPVLAFPANTYKGRGQKGWVIISFDRYRGLERLHNVCRRLTKWAVE